MSTPDPDITAIPKDRDNAWLGLYGLTLVLELFSAVTRGVLAWCALTALAFILKLLFGFLSVLHALVNPLALLIGWGPLLWSIAALIYPFAYGWWWQQAIGGRPPSKREQLAVEDALDGLLCDHPEVRRPARWFVVDEPQPNAFVLADDLAIHRGLIDTGYLEAVLAHELGHVNSMDGRVSLAVWRFTPPSLRHRERPYNNSLFGHIRWMLGMLADGTLPVYITGVLWSNYFRAREYAADRYSYLLGQGPQQAEFLEQYGLIHDFPIPWPWPRQQLPPPNRAAHRPPQQLRRNRSARRHDRRANPAIARRPAGPWR